MRTITEFLFSASLFASLCASLPTYAAAPTSVAQMEGYYAYSGRWSPESSWPPFIALCYVKAGQTPNELLIPMIALDGYRFSLEKSYFDKTNGYISATVNFQDKSLTIAPQTLNYSKNEDDNTEHKLSVCLRDENYRIIPGSEKGIVATIDENGSIAFQPNACIMIDEGYDTQPFYMVENRLTPCTPFSYDEKDWRSVGNAAFTESVMADRIGREQVEYDVEVMQNVNDNNLLMIRNPYDNAIWDGTNKADGNGYIIVDIADRDCVLTRPLIPSGFNYSDSKDEREWTDRQDLIILNQEMMESLRGKTSEQIKELLAKKGKAASTFYDKTLRLYNTGYSNTVRPLHCSTISLGDITLKLSENANLSGVESVITDSAEPARYYNLQGMPTAAPADGEPVIEVKDGKSVKRIFRGK